MEHKEKDTFEYVNVKMEPPDNLYLEDTCSDGANRDKNNGKKKAHFRVYNNYFLSYLPNV